MTEPTGGDEGNERATTLADANDERSSVEGKVPDLPELTEDEVARIEARNGLLQTTAMLDAIEASLEAGRFRLRPSSMMSLQRYAVQGLKSDAGGYRKGTIGISNSSHEPPPPEDVAAHVDDLCDYVNDNWESCTPIHLAAYVMWRLNWIHPFSDGNGRTSRAVSYLVLCVRLGFLLPGQETIPERIAANKFDYYHALDEADARWSEGRLDVSKMEALLEGHLAKQLVSIHELASGKSVE